MYPRRGRRPQHTVVTHRGGPPSRATTTPTAHMLLADRLLPASRVEWCCLAAFSLSTPLSAFAAFGGAGAGDALPHVACKFVRLLKHILPALPLTAARAARDTARRAARARDGELGDMDHVPHRGCLPDTTQRTRRRAGRAPWHTARVALSCVRPGRRALEHVHRRLRGDGSHRGLHRPPPIPVRSRCAGWHRARGLAHQLERRPLLLLLQARWPTPARALFFVLTLLFRDATLFRETVECLLVQHHMAGYPHTVADPLLRAHAIACLWWSINGPWVVVPLLSFAWVARRLLPLTGGMVAALRREVKRGEAMAAAAAAATTARDAPARGSGGPESRHAHISGHGRSPSSCSEAM